MLDMWLLLVLLPVIVLVLRSRGVLTERVVAHPNTLSPFPPDLCYDKWKLGQIAYAELESTPPDTELCVAYRLGSCVQRCDIMYS